MPAQLSPPRPRRPLVRSFHPARVAPAALAQVYELLLPGPGRPWALAPPRAAAAPALAPRPAARA